MFFVSRFGFRYEPQAIAVEQCQVALTLVFLPVTIVSFNRCSDVKSTLICRISRSLAAFNGSSY